MANTAVHHAKQPKHINHLKRSDRQLLGWNGGQRLCRIVGSASAALPTVASGDLAAGIQAVVADGRQADEAAGNEA
jgi:hypothetical protein